MIKIARLPNPTFGVADLDPSDERLSRVPPRDTDLRNRPPALSKSAGPRSTGVEAMKMRAKYLILAIALLCLLALPSTALAADDNDSSKVDSSVTTVLDATGGNAAVPVIVYTEPGAEAVVEAVAPTGVETTILADFDAVAAYLTEDEIDALAASEAVDLIVADNPVFGFDYASSMDITNLAIGLDEVAAPSAGGPTGAGVGVAVLDSGIATTSDLGSSRIVGWKDFVNKQRTPYDDAGHGTFVAGLIAGDGTASLPLEDGGYANMQFRGVAPEAEHHRREGPGRHRPGSRLLGHGRRPVGHRPQAAVQHPRAEPLDRQQPRRARRLRPDRQGSRVRLEERDHGRVRRRQRGRVRPRRHPVSRQQPLRDHGRRHDRADAPRRRRHLLQLGRPDALGRVRQARPRGARQPADLAARQGLLHRLQLPAEPDPRGGLRADGSGPGAGLPACSPAPARRRRSAPVWPP